MHIICDEIYEAIFVLLLRQKLTMENLRQRISRNPIFLLLYYCLLTYFYWYTREQNLRGLQKVNSFSI